ncbi:hypothetical protein [Clostridium sp. FP1]|uniref:hypothetical protein n=1 Tax=Clostridium sp. FP1 TaxID=2724076 RepID=UPI0013E959F6|nr:hypothetical protein [Clostridium sp. FP1]MBZ9634645.1 hypothetical protein [Clostridium sp. FP1]
MLSDKELILNNPLCYKYVQRELTFVKNKNVKWYNFLMLENQETLEIVTSEFTDFFYHKDRLNKSINTKKNNYGTILLLYLNYIFFNRDNQLKSIEDISLDIGKEFLNLYVYGDIGRNIIKSNDTIMKAENSLTSFYYWLNNQPKYKLKNIRKDMFVIKTVTYVNRGLNTNIRIEKKCLDSIFTVEYPDKVEKAKLKKPSEFLILTLIEVAKQFDPMLAFPIALQAFAGMRRGEVCQMARQRIINTQPFGRSICFCIDLQEELMLRDDGVRTGMIKRPRIQLVYEAFLPYLDKLFRDHLVILKQRGYDTNKYGAMIIGDNGKSMQTNRYAVRFDNLIHRLMNRILDMANKGNYQATLDKDLLLNYRMTPHSNRYFFTQYVAQREPTHTLAMYRGDLNMNTALTYLKDSAHKVKYIHKLQDSFADSYHNLTGLTL